MAGPAHVNQRQLRAAYTRQPDAEDFQSRKLVVTRPRIRLVAVDPEDRSRVDDHKRRACGKTDYGSLHAAILYNQAGVPFAGDAYDVGGYERDEVKFGFNIAINAKKQRAAVAALADHPKTDRRHCAEIIGAIKRRRRPIEQHFCSDAGVRLMRIDSQLILSALRAVNDNGDPALPVHDSLIVPARCANRTAGKMVGCFEQTIGRASPCRVGIQQPERYNQMRAGLVPNRKRRCCQRRSGAPTRGTGPLRLAAGGSDPRWHCWRGKPWLAIRQQNYAASKWSQLERQLILGQRPSPIASVPRRASISVFFHDNQFRLGNRVKSSLPGIHPHLRLPSVARQVIALSRVGLIS
jgi:hypothetical protein